MKILRSGIYYLTRLANVPGLRGRVFVVPPSPLSREMVEQREIAELAPHACVSRFYNQNKSWFSPRKRFSLGRRIKEEPCAYRTSFVRDRNRIEYSLYYKLLGGKTQVFSPESLKLPEKQFIHHRQLHVAKVRQISWTICRALKLNADLAEAISLAHDLGHTPFGHEGESVLNELSIKYLVKKFKHNRHSLRVVDKVEKLNLTFEVRDGIVKHDGEKKDHLLRPSDNLTLDDSHFPITLEGCAVRLSDRLAYLPMDLEDALILKIITESQIPESVKKVLGISSGEMIDTLVRDVINSSSPEDDYITMSPDIRHAMDELFDFNYHYIYFSEQKERFREDIIKPCINGLFRHFGEEAEASGKTEKQSAQEAIDRIVGMTDQHALYIYQKIAA
jgi:dGTPase